jgi:hypothetical protein
MSELTAVRNVTNRRVNYRVTGTVDVEKRKVVIRLEREEENWREPGKRHWTHIYTGTPKCLQAAIAEVRAELEPQIPPVPELDLPPNAGSCMICCAPFKLDKDGDLVLHGYKRPGYGWIEGRCLATGMLPWEKSPDHLQAYRPIIVAHLERARAWLAKLREGKVENFHRMVSDYSKPRNKDYSQPQMTVTVNRGDGEKWRHRDGYDCPSFASIHEYALHDAELDVTRTEAELTRVDTLLENWKEQPLIHK